MALWISRGASAIVALGYLAVVFFFAPEPKQAIVALLVALPWPLALIWFPEEIGDYIGFTGRGRYIDNPSPAWLVATFGWFFLLGGPGLVAYFVGRGV